MLVSTAMLSFIMLGLTAMFIQTQKAFKSGIRQNTITDAGRSIMEMILGDLRQMSDGQNTNLFFYNSYNFWFGTLTPPAGITNYVNGVAVRSNALNCIYILEHTNTTWVGVGYAVSNFPGAGAPLGIGTLYRYETNWNSLAPAFTNKYFFSQFSANLTTPTFSTNYWHRVADGVIDLRIRAFDQYGNEVDNANLNESYFYYPIVPPLSAVFSVNDTPSTTLPNSVELEFGILEPDTLVQARGLIGNRTALLNFLSTNAAPKMEIFRQRVTIAAAPR